MTSFESSADETATIPSMKSDSTSAALAHFRLKMSGGRLPSDLATNVPSLFQRLPTSSASTSAATRFGLHSSSVSASAAVTASALNVIGIGSDDLDEDEALTVDEKEDEKLDENFSPRVREEAPEGNKNDGGAEADEDATPLPLANDEEEIITNKKQKTSTLTSLLDDSNKEMDLDNVTDITGITAEDVEILSARYLKKLSKEERELVVQDIHGVSNDDSLPAGVKSVEDSLKKLEVELERELVARKYESKDSKKDASTDSTVLKEDSAAPQRKSSQDKAATMTSSATVSMGSTASDCSEAESDIAILKSKTASAFEQALAQCRTRRRERNNSLFCPDSDDSDDEQDGDHDYIDVDHDRDFRLGFLRAERFNAKKAATRILDFFDEKRALFGIDLLARKLRLEDLNEETIKVLESGFIQLLPGRDRAGRAVIVGTKKLADNCSPQNEISALRAFWFLSTIALENVEAETKGFVFVYYGLGADSNEKSDAERRSRRITGLGKVLRALPLAVKSIHWCVDHAEQKKAAALAALLLGGSNYIRVRCHAGTDMEVQYNLMTFGVPLGLFPISMNGDVDLSRHRDFLQQQTKKSDDTSPLLELDEDDDDDIVMKPEGLLPSAPVAGNDDPFDNNPTLSSRLNLPQQLQQQQQQLQNNDNFLGAYNNIAFNNMFYLNNNNNGVSPMQVTSLRQHTSEQFNQYLQGQQQLDGQAMRMKQDFPFGTDQQQSQHQDDTEPVLVPGERDILLGRGRRAQNHNGNVHFREIVETFRQRYEEIPSKGGKTELIREVVDFIYDNGSRFIKQDSFGRWIPVGREVARDKVSHSFRNKKRLSLTKSKKRPASCTAGA